MSLYQRRAYEVAQTQVGISELPGTLHDERILDYHETCTMKAQADEISWCSAFVNWCVIQACALGTNSAAAKSWLEWGIEVKPEEAFVGDLVILTRKDPNNPNAAHVGFLAAPYLQDELVIKVLGGNQANQVCEKFYPKDRVLGIRRHKVQIKTG